MSGIQSSGMHGFSEEGEPSDWDMAVGEVYGYRWWKMHIPAELAGYATPVYSTGPYIPRSGKYPLTGANGCNWREGRMEAECPRNSYSVLSTAAVRHEPPEYREACGCGFWAYFNPVIHVNEIFSGMGTKNPYRVGHDVHLPVFGVVKGTGRVIIGTKGFRSQYAQIIGLCIPDIAKTQLHWDIQARGTDSYSWRGSLLDALRGRPVYRPWQSNDDTGVIRAADEGERLRRYAAVEALLSVAYPDAKILCDEDALRKYFPPDKNYGPGSKFQLDNKYGFLDG